MAGLIVVFLERAGLVECSCLRVSDQCFHICRCSYAGVRDRCSAQRLGGTMPLSTRTIRLAKLVSIHLAAVNDANLQPRRRQSTTARCVPNRRVGGRLLVVPGG
jgi:hypothetical protein